MNARKELFAAKKEAISELMTNALRKDEVKTEDYASLSVVNGGGERKSFSESDLQQMQNILRQFSENDLLDRKWILHIPSSHRNSSVSFPDLQRDTDSILVRALVLQRLAYASPTVSRAVKDAAWILGFFSANHLKIENCRTSTAGLIVSALEADNDFSNMQRNSIMATLGNMVELCSAYGLIAGTGIVDCSHRWKEKRQPKRAPDACAIEQIDSYIFDPQIDIPLQYRTIYMLLRLISNRINEVLFMPIDCITYPDVGIYSIAIPTQKETAYHVPEFHQYPKKLSGQEEGYLHSCIRELQEYARNQQTNLKSHHQDFLFVSPTGRSLVTTQEVNTFLKDVCEKNRIKDASGVQTSITSHDLRHTAVVERFKYGIISPYQTMRESNHSSIAQTCGYGYASVHDESKKLTEISKGMLEDQYAVSEPTDKKIAPRAISKKKYSALCKNFDTRLLLDGSVCVNSACVPIFETCSMCEYFIVDPKWQEPLEEYIAIFTDRLNELEAIGGNPNSIAFLNHQKDVYTRILSKIIDNSANEMEVC